MNNFLKRSATFNQGLIAGIVVFLGTNMAMIFSLHVTVAQVGVYVLLSLFAAVPVGVCVAFGIRAYQRHRYWIIFFPLITPIILFGLMSVGAMIGNQAGYALFLVLPLVYSTPASILAWLIAVIAAELLRRANNGSALPQQPTPTALPPDTVQPL
jgi:hypothetical protein